MSYESLLDYQLGPIRKWPGELLPAQARIPAPFSASFLSTKILLSRELYNLGADAILVQIAMRDEDFRNDGMPRARAIALHPGVMVSFNPDGITADRMEFATDRFTHWQDNLRAIALGLEALRKIDRYAITNGRQQYAGFKALPRGDDGMLGLYTADQAREYLEQYRRGPDWSLIDVVRAAAMKTHPDRGGDEEEFRRVTRARELLDV